MFHKNKIIKSLQEDNARLNRELKERFLFEKQLVAKNDYFQKLVRQEAVAKSKALAQHREKNRRLKENNRTLSRLVSEGVSILHHAQSILNDNGIDFRITATEITEEYLHLRKPE